MGFEFNHRTVLLKEAVDALLVAGTDGIYADGTFGRGGHARAILSRLASTGRLIAFDKDPQAIDEARHISDVRFSIIHDSFASIRSKLDNLGIEKISGILLDLGISSPQIEDPARGFSFQLDGPLDMRMDPTRGESASEWLSRASVQELTKVIQDYGEEPFAFQIAKAFVARRKKSNRLGPLCTTGELTRIISRIVRTNKSGKNPATRTFQAIRIHINQELADLKVVLDTALSSLEKRGRLVVITFHSLEDRIVKQFIRTYSKNPAIDRHLPIYEADLRSPPLKIIGRLFPSKTEVKMNPRARSAVMRVAERTEL
ncbi:MAG: 16S rRNA (cytosine(1402)-N(4))-methyltransferase RsmH [Burkholderia sp.]|nr:16S rRNA (cytosine(1402)-N(4))-methyltransferase RsmH [Burkholderia sp.]